MSRMERGIAVVGGGPAGLAAAWRLVEKGHRVRLYEASSRIGGLLRTEEVAGRGADVAVQLLSAGYTEALELLASMGVGDRVVRVPGRDALWRDGRVHGLRYGSVPSMVASGALPTRLKIRMGLRYVPFLERHDGVLDLNAPARAAEAGLDDLSIADWGREHIGDDFVEWLAYPLLAAYYGVTPEETSAAVFHGLAKSGMGVEVLGIRGGFGSLAAAMAAALTGRGVEIRTDEQVRRLEPVAGGVRVVTGEDALEHDAVVLAVPAAAAASLVPSLSVAAAVRTRSTATLVLALRERLATGWFGLSVPRTEPGGETLAAVTVQEEKETGLGTKVDARAESGSGEAVGGALVLVPAPAAAERWSESEPAAVLEEALEALRQVLPAAADRVEEARLVRLKGAVWMPESGHFQRVASFRPDSLPRWLSLAGDYLVAPTVEGAVRSGLTAADRAAATAGEG